MNNKQWMAVVQLVTGPLILLWLAWDFADGRLDDGSMAGTAQTLLWATGAVIVLGIVGMIVVAIGVSIVRREEWSDEPADERDDAIDARAARIGYTITSLLAAATLFPIAFGIDPLLAVAMLFLAPMGGGLVHAAAVLALYRVG